MLLEQKKIAVIYTGGTIGMDYPEGKTTLQPQPLFHSRSKLTFLKDWQEKKRDFDLPGTLPHFFSTQFRENQNLFAQGHKNFLAPNPKIWQEKMEKIGQEWAFWSEQSFFPGKEIFSSSFFVDIFSWALPLDSSSIQSEHWVMLAQQISILEPMYESFVVLHGTDSLAYTASALNFCLMPFGKRIFFTGSAMPLLFQNSEAPANFLLSLLFAQQNSNLQGGWVLFGQKIIPGTRASKIGGGPHFFDSYKKNPLKILEGIKKAQNSFAGLPQPHAQKKEQGFFSNDLLPILVQPALTSQNLEILLNMPGFRSVLFLCYGSGNFPEGEKFLKQIKKALDKGLGIFFISQCPKGEALSGAYHAGFQTLDDRIVNLRDMTLEAALTKLMWASALYPHFTDLSFVMGKNLRGEISETSP